MSFCIRHDTFFLALRSEVVWMLSICELFGLFYNNNIAEKIHKFCELRGCLLFMF